ncbi:hypothetical protein CS063_00595 [Sporanaerobium hydrogeniformans]|uniref:Uncharacterized protein n=1 Tax=Sporanaerobium hydrogeniformans TaxID=3072179 RepID=A0AC61DGL9_9FIRM|nr:hypothetical protein CS063_00595 [Sporanaerobium hydrogeniformans]
MYFFYFIIYSFLGWIIEGLFNWATQGSFKKPNFLLIPLKPMYGFAATFLLLFYPLVSFPFFLLLAFIIPLGVEYLSGWLLDHYYGLRFWDYRKQRFNIGGYICLQFAIYWVILSLLLLYTLQPLIAYLYFLISPWWTFFSWFIFAYLLWDFLTSSHYYRHKISSSL